MVGLFGCWDMRCGVSGCSTCCLVLVITDMIDGIVVGVWFVFWFNRFAGLLFDCSVLLSWRCDYGLLMAIL